MDRNTEHLAANLVGVLTAIARKVYHEREEASDKEAENSAISRAGSVWTGDEEAQLRRELGLAIDIMAYTHKRNTGGIHSKLKALFQVGRTLL